MASTVLDLQAAIRTIPDYPKAGILFRDITTLLGDPRAFRRAVDELVHPWAGSKIDKVAGIEARGFIIGGAVAHQLSAGFVPIRKRGKLPHETVRIAYSLEYGLDEMEMHRDAIRAGEKTILVDDLIATGGTAEAAVRLLKEIGADVVAADLRHRSAGSRRPRADREAWRAGPHAGGISRALIGGPAARSPLRNLRGRALLSGRDRRPGPAIASRDRLSKNGGRLMKSRGSDACRRCSLSGLSLRSRLLCVCAG